MRELTYESIDEEILYFDLPDSDGLKIKGILRGNFNEPMTVIMHGKPGAGNELLPYLGARYLFEKGLSTLRLFMYDFSPDTRNLLDCTLETHVEDFDVVLAELRKRGVKKIFGIGHSFGGITILRSDSKLDGAVLWDPTHGSFWAEHPAPDENFPEIILDNIKIGTSGYGYVGSIRDDEQKRKMGDTSDWAANKDYPLMIISAGKGSMAHLGKRYIDVAAEPKKHIVIENASHHFEDSDDVILQLFEESTNWLNSI
jgi:hypothetical protein